MPIYSRDDYMPIPTDIPKYDQFANPIDSNFYIKELENKTNGIYLPEKIHNYSNFEYDEETTIMLLKDIAKIAENIELMDTKSIINYYSSFISQETKNQNKISDEILSSEYLPNVSEDLLVPITSIINNIKNVIYTTYLIDSSLNDITIQFDGKLYFILAQYAYTTYDEYEKMSLEERNWLKDGGVLFDPNNPYVFSSDNWDIARSSCSACATFNAVFNLLTPSEIIEFLSENKNLYANTINNILRQYEASVNCKDVGEDELPMISYYKSDSQKSFTDFKGHNLEKDLAKYIRKSQQSPFVDVDENIDTRNWFEKLTDRVRSVFNPQKRIPARVAEAMRDHQDDEPEVIDGDKGQEPKKSLGQQLHEQFQAFRKEQAGKVVTAEFKDVTHEQGQPNPQKDDHDDMEQ